jgi:hypothetical protein
MFAGFGKPRKVLIWARETAARYLVPLWAWGEGTLWNGHNH